MQHEIDLFYQMEIVEFYVEMGCFIVQWKIISREQFSSLFQILMFPILLICALFPQTKPPKSK